jgi:hypothetical protein
MGKLSKVNNGGRERGENVLTLEEGAGYLYHLPKYSRLQENLDRIIRPKLEKSGQKSGPHLGVAPKVLSRISRGPDYPSRFWADNPAWKR